MWIVNPGIGEGSGVLLGKKFKLAVTNTHVTNTSQAVDVYFLAPEFLAKTRLLSSIGMDFHIHPCAFFYSNLTYQMAINP